MNNSSPAIQTEGLHKSFGTKVAVADLTLEVPKGEVFGFLGPNGAGKSTAVKMLLGLVRPDAGAAQVLGRKPGDPAALARVGFLPEHFRFHEWLQAGEFLDLHGKLYGMSPAARTRRIPEVLELVGLLEHSRRQLSGFSKGMLQRIGLAQALLNEPELVVLDEPTSALDPFGRMLVRGIIHKLKAGGTTVFLNSHLLGEVEATCDRVSFIREGTVLRTLSLRETEAAGLKVELRVSEVTPALLAALSDLVVEWRFLDTEGGNARPEPVHSGSFGSFQPFEPDGSTAAHLEANREANRPEAGIAVAGTGTTALELTLQHEEMLPLVAVRVLRSGARLYALTPHRVSLEQLFLEIVGREDSGQ
ncbi:MAG: ABC transporter ATP-binding protein [Chloroflexota bacterium]|nr:ABC transporter ATP-binding protein [Chloroflexota bacterium]